MQDLIKFRDSLIHRALDLKAKGVKLKPMADKVKPLKAGESPQEKREKGKNHLTKMYVSGLGSVFSTKEEWLLSVQCMIEKAFDSNILEDPNIDNEILQKRMDFQINLATEIWYEFNSK